MIVSRSLAFALSLAMLSSLPFDLVCMYTPSVEFPKARLRRREGRMPKRVGARMGALFHTTFNVKWFGHNYCLVLDGCPHTVMKRYYHALKLQGVSNHQEDVEEPIPANQVKGLH